MDTDVVAVPVTNLILFSVWTAFFTSITPITILFSIWLRREWATKALETLILMQKTSERTQHLVLTQRTVLLKSMSLLAKSHASMAKSVALITNEEHDLAIAHQARLSADLAERELQAHEDHIAKH